jgi:hypothetical protein
MRKIKFQYNSKIATFLFFVLFLEINSLLPRQFDQDGNSNFISLTANVDNKNLKNKTKLSLKYNSTIFNLSQYNWTDMNITRYKRLKNRKKNMTTPELLKAITDEIIDITQRMNISLKIKKKVFKEIEVIEKLSSNLTKRMDLYDIRTRYQLDALSHSMIMQVEVALVDELMQIQEKIKKQKRDLIEDDIKIENLKNKLPNPNSVCNKLLNCSTCAANPRCGWCESSNQCVDGDKTGPKNGFCPFYNFDKCPHKSDCSSYNTCNQCMQDVGCGWCSDLNLNTHICLNKNEAEKGLCNFNFFHHVWKKNYKLSTCPKKSSKNFIDFIKKNLHHSNDFKLINKDPLYSPDTGDKFVIKVPDFNDITESLKSLEEILYKKIKEQISLDRLLKTLKRANKDMEKLRKEMKELEDNMKLNSTIKYEIAVQTFRDLKSIIQIHADKNQTNVTNFVDDMFKEDIDRFYKEMNESMMNKTKLKKQKEKEKREMELKKNFLKNLKKEKNHTCQSKNKKKTEGKLEKSEKLDKAHKNKNKENKSTSKHQKSSFLEIENNNEGSVSLDHTLFKHKNKNLESINNTYSNNQDPPSFLQYLLNFFWF